MAYATLALGLSTLAVRKTRDHVRFEAARHPAQHRSHHGELTTGQVAWITSIGDKALSATSQAGMVNNLNDALAWGIFPAVRRSRHSCGPDRRPGCPLSGHLGSRATADRLVVGQNWSQAAYRHRMLVQAAAIALVAAGTTFPVWAAQILLGVGTALVYPTLLAAIGGVAHPAWRARALGVYRLWRDGGFALGALLAERVCCFEG